VLIFCTLISLLSLWLKEVLIGKVLYLLSLLSNLYLFKNKVDCRGRKVNDTNVLSLLFIRVLDNGDGDEQSRK
jgi:hypothetical protein